LRNHTPVGGRTNGLPVELENGHVVGSAEARGTLDDNLKHALAAALGSQAPTLIEVPTRANGF